MDEQQFVILVRRFNFSSLAVDQLRQVLVEGRPAAQVAKQFGISRQTLSNKVIKVRREMQRLEEIAMAARVATDPLALDELLNDLLSGRR